MRGISEGWNQAEAMLERRAHRLTYADLNSLLSFEQGERDKPVVVGVLDL